MYLERSPSHFSHLFPCNLAERSRSSLEGFLFISFVSWQVWLCLSWLGEEDPDCKDLDLMLVTLCF